MCPEAMHTPSEKYRLLAELDFSHLWHPFTQTKVWQEELPLILERGEGCYLFDVDGNRYIDGISALWCNVHGHSHPELLRAVHDQADKLCHSTLLGSSHIEAIEFAAELTTRLPPALTRVFYSDSGSAAVEASLRMAVEWWSHQAGDAAKKRTQFASLESSYHGDTLGSVGVGYSRVFHERLDRVVIPAKRCRPPHLIQFEDNLSAHDALGKAIEELDQLFSSHGANLAAFVVEPIVQGAAGIWIHSPAYLRAIADRCQRHGVLLICDEVATGFGKTGRLFAFEHADIVPDILVIGKGISAGYLPLSAAVTTDKIFNGFTAPVEALKTFFYGQTFSGNPLATAVARASLKLFDTPDFFSSLQARIERFHSAVREKIDPLPMVCQTRAQGMMLGIELTQRPGAFVPFGVQEKAGIRVVREARKRGVIIRPIGNVVILVPALAMEESMLEALVQVTAESLQAALGEGSVVA